MKSSQCIRNVSYTHGLVGVCLFSLIATVGWSQSTPKITWPTPAAITYGTALSSRQLDATTSVQGTFAYTPASGTVLPVGAAALSVTFTPTNTTLYDSATKTVTLTVNQETPTIRWPNPASVSYGTALSSRQLDATCSVPGTFSYASTIGTLLPVGANTLSVTFSPTDTTDYVSATQTTTLVVNQATPVISWPTPAAITYGTALSATQLNATASVPGSFTYSPAAGTTPAAGTDTLSVTFTPTDTVDYATATTTVQLVVNPSASNALLQLRINATPASVTLSNPVNLDWIVWGADGSTTAATRMTGSNLISDITPLNSASIVADSNGTVQYTWSGGTPIPSGTSVGAEMTTSGVNAGFQLTAPADTSVKTLLLYVFINPNAQISAAVSDGSSPSITHSPATSQDAGYEIYSIDYRAASPGQTMTVQIVSTDSSASVGLQAAVLQPHLPQVSIILPTPSEVFTASGGLPASIPASFDATQFDTNIASVQLLANGVQTASIASAPYTSTWAAAPGHYTIQAQATDAAGLTNTSPIQALDVIGTGGSLSETFGQLTSSVDLTSEGTADWEVFGPSNYDSSLVSRKQGVVPLISAPTVIGPYSSGKWVDIPGPFSFEDGYPDAQESGILPIAYVNGSPSPGFQFSILADNTSRTLRLYGSATGNVQLTAFLSDGSAPVITDSSLSNTTTYNNEGQPETFFYTIRYSAALPSQTLTVQLVAQGGQILLSAASLTGLSVPVPPIVTSITPNGTTAGSLVSIAGSGFGSSQGSGVVTLGGVVAAVSSWNDLTIQAYVPVGVQSGAVQVVTNGGASNTNIEFALAPNITNLSPSAGTVGTVVTITGSGFGSSQGGGSVTFNGIVATPTNWSDTQIVVPVPAGATTGNVLVTQSTPAIAMPLFTVMTGTQGSLSPLLELGLDNSPGLVSLTNSVNQDWIIWGSDGVSATATRKAGVSLIGMTPVNTNLGSVPKIVQYSWSGGIPTAAGNALTAGIVGYNSSGGTPAIQVTAPADTTARTLKVFSSNTGQQELTAAISDGSSPVVNYTVAAPNDFGEKVYSINYRAASAGQTLTVQLTAIAPNSVFLEAAVLLPYLPQVAVLSPQGGQDFPVQTSIPVGIDAAQIDFPISAIALSANGNQFAALQSPSYTTVWAPPQGHYSLQAQATDESGLTNASSPVDVDIVGSGGSLTVVRSAPQPGPINLTSEGTADWITFGSMQICTGQYPGSVRKAGVAPLISTSNLVGDLNGGSESLDNMSFAFEDGSPDSHESQMSCAADSNNGVADGKSGIEFSVSADTNVRTLRLYVGTGNARGRLTAFLSDGSASVYVDSSVQSNQDNYDVASVYAITFSAASPGQTLTVKWTLDAIGTSVQESTDGEVQIFAATLSGSPVNPTPAITATTPSSGGFGSPTSIFGTGFGASQGANSVEFGGVAATVTRWTDTEIDVIVPQVPAGNEAVTVSNVAIGGSTFSVLPLVSTIAPATGSLGSLITITGNAFGATQGGSAVTVGSLGASVTSWSDTQIQALVPSGIGSGPQYVMVTVAGASSSGVAFGVVPPSITAFSPAIGIAGTLTTITGSGFGATQGNSAVYVGVVPAVATAWSDTQIQLQIPSIAEPGNQNLTVTEGVLSNTSGYFFVEPWIMTISPGSGLPGTVVTVHGSNLGADSSSIAFNGASASVINWSPTAIQAVVPSGATTGPVIVSAYSPTNYVGIPTNAVNFTTVVGPSILSLSPVSGSPGSIVTISGENLGASQASSTITFNGIIAVPSTWGPYSIVVPVPVGTTTGPVLVTVGGVPSNSYTYSITNGISSIAPAQGPPGTIVTITGLGFGIVQGNSTVTFNGVVATPSSWGDSGIVVPVPTGATTGPVIVTTSGSPGKGTMFWVLIPPSILNISPNAGPVGTQVTIAGTGFQSSQGTSTIQFNGTTATATTWSNSQISVTVPAGATSGNVVVSIGGVSSNGVSYTVGPAAPDLEIASPTNGTIVNPGQSLSVTVTSSNTSYSNVALIGEGPIGLNSSLQTTVPAQFTVNIPNNIVCEPYMLTASGQTTSGSTIDSDPITVDVERPDMPVSVNALMSSVTLDAPGESFPIKLFAVFGDGSALDVTNSSYVSYSSNSPNLFSVDASGDVTALAPGYGWVVASYTLNSQTVQAIIPITVSTGPLTSSAYAVLFGSQSTFSNSVEQQVTLTNSTAGSLQITNLITSGDFLETDNCTSLSPLPSGGTCVVNLTFAPGSAGPRSGNLAIGTSFASTTISIALSGIGTAPQ